MNDYTPIKRWTYNGVTIFNIDTKATKADRSRRKFEAIYGKILPYLRLWSMYAAISIATTSLTVHFA